MMQRTYSNGVMYIGRNIMTVSKLRLGNQEIDFHSVFSRLIIF